MQLREKFIKQTQDINKSAKSQGKKAEICKKIDCGNALQNKGLRCEVKKYRIFLKKPLDKLCDI